MKLYVIVALLSAVAADEPVQQVQAAGPPTQEAAATRSAVALNQRNVLRQRQQIGLQDASFQDGGSLQGVLTDIRLSSLPRNQFNVLQFNDDQQGRFVPRQPIDVPSQFALGVGLAQSDDGDSFIPVTDTSRTRFVGSSLGSQISSFGLRSGSVQGGFLSSLDDGVAGARSAVFSQNRGGNGGFLTRRNQVVFDDFGQGISTSGNSGFSDDDGVRLATRFGSALPAVRRGTFTGLSQRSPFFRSNRRRTFFDDGLIVGQNFGRSPLLVDDVQFVGGPLFL